MNSLWNLWQTTAKRHAGKVVVIDADTDRAWTCAQLTAEAERLALAVDGPVVPICEPNSARWLATFLAIQKNHAAVVPLDPSLTTEAQSKITNRILTRPLRNVCCVKLTSGTTGELKNILCSATHLHADGDHIIYTMGIRPTDRNLAIIPLGHSYGLGNLVMPLLLQGTMVVCAQTFVPRQIMQLIEKYQVTVFPTVPVILHALSQLKGASFSSCLRLVISAGAPLSAESAQQFHRRFCIKIHNFYGSSETGGICYDRTGNATLTGRSVGKPVHDVTVRVRRDGRICVASRAGKATLADLGEWNRYGELRLLGRIGEVANIGGKKVAPAEIERALRELRGVSDVWIAILKDKRGNDYLAAAVETARDLSEIEDALLKNLPLWKLPKVWLIDSKLPRSERGKLHTVELRARLSISLP